MLSIRLARTGRKKRPYFRIVVSEKHRNPLGKNIEILGHFDPRQRKETLTINKERAGYWISVGAQPTGAVHNILVDEGLLSGKKQRVNTFKKKEDEKKPNVPKEKVKEEAVPTVKKAEETSVKPKAETSGSDKKPEPSKTSKEETSDQEKEE